MNRVHLHGISLAWAVCGLQVLISAIAALVMIGFWGRAEAKASLFGGIVAIAPNIYFALRIYLRRPDDEPKAILGRFYQAEIGKFALTAVLFFFGVTLFAQQFSPLIFTYMACIAAYWLVIAVARVD